MLVYIDDNAKVPKYIMTSPHAKVIYVKDVTQDIWVINGGNVNVTTSKMYGVDVTLFVTIS